MSGWDETAAQASSLREAKSLDLASLSFGQRASVKTTERGYL
jgi:hypothetical protein